MRANTANQHVVAVKHQVLWRNGRSQKFVTIAYVFGSIFGGDMLEHHFQRGQTLTQRFHHRFNKACFAIENIDICMRDFAVHQQWHTQFFHPLQHRHDGVNRGYTMRRVGGGIGWIEFCRGEYAFVKSTFQLVGIQRIR